MRGLPFFLALLVLLKIQLIVGVWRYNNILEDENLFTLKNAVFLKYDGSDFVEWEYPESCNVNNKSSPNAIMKCTSPGFQMVKPLVSSPEEEETRYLFISDSFFSFIWYAVVPIDRGSTETSSKKVRMWIIDPEQADPAEINNTALVPSTQSRYITKHFYNNGQYPVITLTSKQTHLGHFQKDGYWEAVIPGDERYNDFHIYGQPISFQHRFVIEGQHTFYWPEPTEPNREREVSLRLAPGSPLLLVWGTCELYHGLLLSDTGALITKNAFLTSEELKVDPGSLPVPPEGYFTVDQAALLEDGIIFRIDGALYWRDNQDRVLTEHPQLPTSGVMGLYQRTCCASNYPVQDVELSSLIVWKDNVLLVGPKQLKNPGRANFLKIVLTVPPTVTFLTASFGSHPASLATLVMNSVPGAIPRSFLTSYNELVPSWITSTFMTKFKLKDIPKGPFEMRFLESADASLLLWNKETILYSFHNDNEWGEIRPFNASHLSAAANGSKIHQVALDNSWNMLVKMENNILFYCKVGMHEVVRLHKWIEPDSRMVLYLNQKEQIHMLTLTPEGLHVQKYPMLMETKSAMKGSYHDCPFISFEHSMNTISYNMDKGDQMVLWAQIVYPEGKGVHVKLLSNNEDLLNIEQKSHFEGVNSVDTVNTTFIISQKVDYSDATSYTHLTKKTSGILTLELVPNQIGNTCNLPKSRISHFNVGCPPNRHIRVARPWGMPCEMHSLTNYTILRSVLRDQQQDDLVVDYDWEKFGCLLKTHYKNPFHPSLDLYDGDNFVRNVDANFIVWDRFGRKDYSFNATMRQVACLREAQTWSFMLTGGKSLEEAWGPENYRTCFKVIPGKLGNLDQPYEIMNRSSKNFLTFSQVDSATYVFNVKILDPNYSFCDLHAVFAVQTYGITIPKHQHLTTYVAIVFTLFSLCILGYSYCQYVTIFRYLLATRKHKYE
ncbi:cation channel sperm-associated protein subunit epsilon isoform X2 [Coregonus clupeaformis]|uniref:cation channel sperm-associated protein subunit epsilon isoform X2 n=1 Tax=Coregonus clupeaformis TaxID=59861 RepID=UPI001BE1282B|nr:cation channel sperm-associated protein subunit epsilon isoform X2 [Coregonus clupeaformis]